MTSSRTRAAPGNPKAIRTRSRIGLGCTGSSVRVAGRVASVNEAVTVLSPSMVTVTGLPLPSASPNHSTNVAPGPATAVSVTVLPGGYCARSGSLVTLPLPLTSTLSV